MLSRKRLVDMARKWQKAAVLGRKRISWEKAQDANACGELVAEKGHFILYTCEGKMFMVPIAFLNSTIFQELLLMAKEEFGLPGHGPIMLPCNAAVFEHVLSLLKRRGLKFAEKDPVLSSLIRNYSGSSLLSVERCRQLAVF